MSLDFETKIALAGELEDIALELATINPSSHDEIGRFFQLLQAETVRLMDISELYGYDELVPIVAWVQNNVEVLEDKPETLLLHHEAGLFITWVELLAALLPQYDEDLFAELEMTFSDSVWSHAIDKRLLHLLLDSLAHSSPLVAEETVVLTDNVVEQLVIIKKPELFTTEQENTQKSTYRLSPDDDVHPELLEAFFIETPDQVIEVAELIRHISTGESDKASHQVAARIAHTIKGSSAVVGIEAVASFAHKLEDILEYSVEYQLPPEVADLLVESSDCLEAMFDSLLTQSLPPQQYPQLLKRLADWDKKFSSGYIYQPEETELPKNLEINKVNEVDEVKEEKRNRYELAWNKDVHPELLEAYMGETPEHVVEIAQVLRDIGQKAGNQPDGDTHNTVREACQKASRLAHTIKGTSAVVGINAVANIGQLLEEILDYGAENTLPISLIPLLCESADLLESLYDSLLSEGVPPKEYPELYEKLGEWREHIASNRKIEQEDHIEEGVATDRIEKIERPIEASASDEPSNTFNLNLAPLEDILPIPITSPAAPPVVTAPLIQRTNLNETTLRVPVSVIDKLLSFTSELITSNTQISDQISLLLNERHRINENNERIRAMVDELEWAVNQQSVSTSSGHNVKPDGMLMDSLEMDSYNELHSITGLLSEAIEDDRKMSISLVRQLNEFKAQAHTQKQINNELSSTVLNMRMESVSILTPRLQRIVRETCRQTEKQAELEIIGDELALDTDVIKGLVDPLLHLLRNAVDHGIESVDIRQENSKSEIGNIRLTFVQKGDHVILLLKDDGVGIDAEKIYQTALKKGLVDNDKFFSTTEKLRLILLAGFSTRDKVTETSGRGVGMDVVNTAVKNLSGNISIRSEKNKGSEIRIQVPLTLSTANVLLVDILGNTLAIPNASIEQVHYLTQGSIEEKQGKLFIQYQQKDIPVLALSTLLSWSTSRLVIDKSQSVLIIKYSGKQYALYVDHILKPLNITIKTLKPWMTNITGVNGVCLLPDGVVAPVLNLFDLLRSALKKSLSAPINTIDSAAININKNKILVVDDSLSNRTALRLLLESFGYEVGTAVDGADALQQLEKTLFKLVITDLEMPNMNGLEMVESLRVGAETKNLPIIMVTSRSTSKHRTLAMQAGVDEYLTKPVDSYTLQTAIEQYETSELLKKVEQ